MTRPAISSIAPTSASMTISPSTSLAKPTEKKVKPGYFKNFIVVCRSFFVCFLGWGEGTKFTDYTNGQKVAVSIAPCNPFDLVSSSATKKFNKHVHFLKVPSKWYPIKYAVGGIFITV